MSCGCDCETEVEAEFKVCADCTTAAKCESQGYCASKKETASVCPPGEEMVDGECQVVSVTLDLSVDATHAFVEASTGNTIIEITGVAFHEGFNKNAWAITKEGARAVARQMEGTGGRAEKERGVVEHIALTAGLGRSLQPTSKAAEFVINKTAVDAEVLIAIRLLGFM